MKEKHLEECKYVHTVVQTPFPGPLLTPSDHALYPPHSDPTAAATLLSSTEPLPIAEDVGCLSSARPS